MNNMTPTIRTGLISILLIVMSIPVCNASTGLKQISLRCRRIVQHESDVFLDYSVIFYGEGNSLLRVPTWGLDYEVDYFSEEIIIAHENGTIVQAGKFVLVSHSPREDKKYHLENAYRGRLRLCSVEEYRQMLLNKDGQLKVTLSLQTLDFPLAKGVKTINDFEEHFSPEYAKDVVLVFDHQKLMTAGDE